MKKIIKREDKFANVFIKESDAKLAEEVNFLSEYLKFSADVFMEDVYNKFLMTNEIESKDIIRVRELMGQVDLNELYVNFLLNGEERLGEVKNKGKVVFDSLEQINERVISMGVQSINGKRIVEIMRAGLGTLKGWDSEFIFGNTGSDLLNQCHARGGSLSPKQERQISRIEKVLRIKK